MAVNIDRMRSLGCGGSIVETVQSFCDGSVWKTSRDKSPKVRSLEGCLGLGRYPAVRVSAMGKTDCRDCWWGERLIWAADARLDARVSNCLQAALHRAACASSSGDGMEELVCALDR
jgi:hypothetical protein